MIYLAIFITIALFVIAYKVKENAGKRQEHRNRSEGAIRGWRKRRVRAMSNTNSFIGKPGKTATKTYQEMRKENGV